MADLVTVYSQNCQGLGNMQKRRDLFHYVRKQGYNIICLQDVHLTDQLFSYIKAEWGNDFYMNAYTSNSRGVIILFQNNFEFKVEQIYKDNCGNYLILDVIINNYRTTLASIYGPNEDNPDFYENFYQQILSINNEYTILCGDWNLIIDPSLDYENYSHINNPRARQIVIRIIEHEDYVDIWRQMNENVRGFTWRRFNPSRKQARLDYF